MDSTTPEGIKDNLKGGVESDIEITFVFFQKFFLFKGIITYKIEIISIIQGIMGTEKGAGSREHKVDYKN